MNDELENLLYRENVIVASRLKRAVSAIMDEFLLSFLLLIALWESFSQLKTTEEIIIFTNSFVLEYMVLKVIYQTFFVMQYGATLGKIVMKIRVIEIQTLTNPNIIVSLNRAIFRVLSELLFYLGFLWAIIDPSRQAWHDKTAKTLVVDV